MPNPWLTTTKPSFQTEWLALPPKEGHQILEKINRLAQDPTPDAKVKKQLKYMGGKLHRLRSGHYRIFYTFEHPYISLLALRRRDDDTYDEDYDAEFLGGLDPDLQDLIPQHERHWEKMLAPTPAQSVEPLPEPLTVELLQRLQIPDFYHQRLLRIGDRDALIACPGIPDETLLKLDEYLFERPLADRLQQPDHIAQEVSDLLRFKQGDLLSFLLKLSPEQEKFVTWAADAKGPTLLKGGPGTGKSTVAIYRTRELLQRLQASGIEQPKLLFTTYTNALVHFSQQLLEQLLGSEARHVEVKTADAVMWGWLRQRGSVRPTIKPEEARPILSVARDRLQPQLPGNPLEQQAQQLVLQRLSIDYLLEEIESVIIARSLPDLAAYQDASRSGRLVPLNALQRQAIWLLYEQFEQDLAAMGCETWSQMRRRALASLRASDRPPVYDAVIVDEAQDLEANALRFLVEVCRAPNRLFITADANQAIYGSGFRWRDVHADLSFVGRTGILRINHRTTREINEAAWDYLQIGALDPEDGGDRHYIHSGPPPAVRAIADAEAEAQLLAQFCRTAAREFRLGLGACAILAPSNSSAQHIAQRLSDAGLEATYMSSRDLDLKRSGIKVLTLKAAKGLEFPIVAIAGFTDSRFPFVPPGTDTAARAEIDRQERRTLFVAMTRAMRALLVIVPEQHDSELLFGFEPQLWNLGASAA